jgi:membrane protein
MKSVLLWVDRVYLGVDRRLHGWPTLLIRTGLAFDQDDGALMSRSIAYYALFSIFPLLLVLVSFSSFALDSAEVQQLVQDFVEGNLPVVADLVQGNVEQILAARSTVGIIALVSLLWSASGVFSALYRAVNRAWGNPKSELFWAEKIFGLVVVLLVGLLLVAATLYSTIVSVLQNWIPSFFVSTAGSWRWLSTLLPPLVTAVTFIILYRIIPKNGVTWRDVWLGGLVAGLVWEAARRLYAWYLANAATYSLIYGSVGAIIGFLLWAYLSAQILLLGAEFTAQYSEWRKAGRPIESRPIGQWMNEWSKEGSQADEFAAR